MGHKVTGWDMGHRDGTGATERGQRRGQEPPNHHPAPLYLLFPPGKLCPWHPLQGHSQAHAGTLLENWDISWKGGFGFPLFPPSRKNCCPHVALGPFLAKMLHFPGKKSLRRGGLEPQRNGGFPSCPQQDLGRSIVLPGEGKLMGFKGMKEKGLEKHSPLFLKDRA